MLPRHARGEWLSREPASVAAGEEFETIERSMAVLRLVSGSHESARNISWKHSQKAEPAGPPKTSKPAQRCAGTAAGHALGALCVLDTKPRQCGEHEKRLLEVMAEEVMEAIGLRATSHPSAIAAASARLTP